jgi:predicted nucleic acid-binding protein
MTLKIKLAEDHMGKKLESRSVRLDEKFEAIANNICREHDLSFTDAVKVSLALAEGILKSYPFLANVDLLGLAVSKIVVDKS